LRTFAIAAARVEAAKARLIDRDVEDARQQIAKIPFVAYRQGDRISSTSGL
jgi:hypothetical protein